MRERGRERERILLISNLVKYCTFVLFYFLSVLIMDSKSAEINLFEEVQLSHFLREMCGRKK